MIKRLIRRTLRRLGYDILKVPPVRPVRPLSEPPAVTPVWPLPRPSSGLTDDEVRQEFVMTTCGRQSVQ